MLAALSVHEPNRWSVRPSPSKELSHLERILRVRLAKSSNQQEVSIVRLFPRSDPMAHVGNRDP